MYSRVQLTRSHAAPPKQIRPAKILRCCFDYTVTISLAALAGYWIVYGRW